MYGDGLSDKAKDAAKQAGKQVLDSLDGALKQGQKVLEHPVQGLQESFDALNNSPIGYAGLARAVKNKLGITRD